MTKYKKLCRVQIYFILLTLLMISPSCTKKDASAVYPKSVTIEFKVSGTVAKANISYSVGAEVPTVVNDASLPYDLKITKTVAYLDGVMLQASYSTGSLVTLNIVVDNVVAETQTCSLFTTTNCLVNHTFF